MPELLAAASSASRQQQRADEATYRMGKESVMTTAEAEVRQSALVAAETACEILHKALPRKRYGPGPVGHACPRLSRGARLEAQQPRQRISIAARTLVFPSFSGRDGALDLRRERSGCVR